ncbi:hypothetical protein ADIMK_1763 [Marinobacterium lacunae]|uniref:DUF5610 domain-containing protein n=1 Tax=Marinobacterium lacunae TaxID=1232683 RepID=A0A081FZS3_9GAMM|nr:DUF5610 domain-containing protein [Marinobacterium lacunae]KEA64028.1 hypothetical protein ADIMK_1763 [Marinobacterium lacunae]
MPNISFSPLSTQLYNPVKSNSDQNQLSGSLNASAMEKLLGKLADNIPGMTAEDIKALEADDYTPEKVAGRIADFVASGLASAADRGADSERLQSMYQAALEGVEKGFAQAREVLSSLNVLHGDIAAQVDATEAATNDALAAIAPGQSQPSDITSSTRIGMFERFSNAEDMTLEVTTRDGDRISINFSRSQSFEAAFAASTDSAGGSAAFFSLSRSESSEYQFSVEGDLDEDELDALQNLIKDVSKLADEFFDGDVQKAFERSAHLDFDSAELSSMNLNMSYSRQYSSVASYEQVQQTDQAVDKPGRRLGHLMKELADSVGAPSLGFLGAPGQFGRELFSGLIQQDARYTGASDEQQTQMNDNLSRLLDSVLPQGNSESDDLLNTDTESE